MGASASPRSASAYGTDGPEAERVVLLDGGYPSYDRLRATLAERGYELEVVPEEAAPDRSAKIEAARSAAGLFVRWTEVDGPFLEALERCRALVRFGTGYDNVDLAAATRRRVGVANVSGYARHSVSDHALALLFGCVRALGYRSASDPSRFLGPPVPSIPEIGELTVGVVGLGAIGSRFAEKARALGAEIVAADPYVSEAAFRESGARRLELGPLLDAADAVSLHCNLTPETRRLIDAEALDRLGPGAYLVNTARGGVIDEEALLQALDGPQLAAAGLDVFGEEPPSASYEQLLGREDVLATGHYGWYSDAAYAELHRRAGANLADLLEGRPPEDCLNPEVYEGGGS